MAQLEDVDPATASDLLEQGRAILIDIRDGDEHARERIPGAWNVPLAALDPADFAAVRDRIGIFHCNSGQRTAAAAAVIQGLGFAETRQLSGGLQAWKKAGLAVVLDRKAPLPIMRQVQIAAGTLVLLGVLLAALVSPWFMALSGFVGAGLIFAGISGFCGMARLLAAMPWNRAGGSTTTTRGTAAGTV